MGGVKNRKRYAKLGIKTLPGIPNLALYSSFVVLLLLRALSSSGHHVQHTTRKVGMGLVSLVASLGLQLIPAITGLAQGQSAGY